MMFRALCFAGLVGCASDPRAPVEPSDPRWPAFRDARIDQLNALAAPIRACVARQDSTHPAFHGCYDWHSAVHGVWALLTVARLTGDPTDQATAEAILQPQALADELAALPQTGAIEIPYGYAWFLRLARERLTAGKADLTPLAQAVAAALDGYLAGLTDTQLHDFALADDYANLSWPLLNLWQYATEIGDDALAGRAVALARRALLPLDAECTLAIESTFVTSFFPPCLHRALALIAMLPPDEAAAFAAAFATGPLSPLTAPSTAHSAGLDFSRSWGLWALWQATGDEAWASLYLDHMQTWLALPQYWAQDYDNYAHWVAQFGVYAVSLSME